VFRFNVGNSAVAEFGAFDHVIDGKRESNTLLAIASSKEHKVIAA